MPEPPVVCVELTVTFTPAEVAIFPAASRARAVRVCAPAEAPVVFHIIEYGEVESVPMTEEPSRNSTEATPTLSDAVAVSVTLAPAVIEAPELGEVRETLGGDMSVVGTTVVEHAVEEPPKKYFEVGVLGSAWLPPQSLPFSTNILAVLAPEFLARPTTRKLLTSVLNPVEPIPNAPCITVGSLKSGDS